MSMADDEAVVVVEVAEFLEGAVEFLEAEEAVDPDMLFLDLLRALAAYTWNTPRFS